MKRTVRIIRWISLNGFFLLLFYIWLSKGIDEAGTFLIIMAWFMAAISLTFWMDTVIEARIKDGDFKPSVPLWLDLAYDLLVVFLFIIAAAPCTAFAHLIQTVMVQGHYVGIEKMLSRKSKSGSLTDTE